MSNIPIVIINRDRLTTTERLVDQLKVLGYENITILDAGSTYEPLLEWYKNTPHIKKLYGASTHKSLWNGGFINLFQDYPWIAVTDSDIELNMDTPKGFIENMIMVAKDYRIDKVGLAIAYKDITNPVYKEIITPIESRYWKQQLVHKDLEVYNAPVDTSFCVIRTDRPFQYNAVRIAGDYICKHTPWYIDWADMGEEEFYYMQHADPNIATCVQHYNTWKTKKD